MCVCVFCSTSDHSHLLKSVWYISLERFALLHFVSPFENVDGKRTQQQRIKTRKCLFLDLLWAMDPRIYRLNIITRLRTGHIAL